MSILSKCQFVGNLMPRLIYRNHLVLINGLLNESGTVQGIAFSCVMVFKHLKHHRL